MTQLLDIGEARAVLIQSFIDTGYTQNQAVLIVNNLFGEKK